MNPVELSFALSFKADLFILVFSWILKLRPFSACAICCFASLMSLISEKIIPLIIRRWGFCLMSYKQLSFVIQLIFTQAKRIVLCYYDEFFSKLSRK